MQCPYCKHAESMVVDSRDSPDGATRRRRACEKCEKRFTTYERVEVVQLTVVKKDGSEEPFSREKLVHGMEKACEKRPVPMEKIARAANVIENELRQEESTSVPSKRVGELVMEQLRGLDHVAYIRFASVYRQFADIGQFSKEIEKLKDKNKKRRM